MVLGDLMLDEYLWGKVARISPEAPIPVVDVDRESFALGGAGNVANNISSLGGQAVLCGVVGADDVGQKLRGALERAGVEARIVADPHRSTTLKTRVIAHSQQVVRVDRESRAPISRGMAQRLLDMVVAGMDGADAFLVSDYGKGVTTASVVQGFIALAREAGKPVLVDPKGFDYGKYKGATVITPNEAEAGEAAGRKITDEATLRYALNAIRRKASCQAVLITRGEKGLCLMEDNGDITHLPTFARQVYDVTGAGDTMVGALALALAAGATLGEAARIANHAAGIVVGRVGTATVTIEDFEKAMEEE
ncbi:MAG: D-glycero-beta-D-manno-heptose-7-phosphate kinase [Chloroflexi bacterium]|nr:D-glycero-beta-D-manno-heptose-7-phosphate kinase [Chloroflexota bacterium]